MTPERQNEWDEYTKLMLDNSARLDTIVTLIRELTKNRKKMIEMIKKFKTSALFGDEQLIIQALYESKVPFSYDWNDDK